MFMKQVMKKPLKKWLGCLLAVVMIITALVNPGYEISADNSTSSSGLLSTYYNTNGTGYGKNSTVEIDGEFSDWDSSMLIAQGVANDDARTFLGTHEGPVYDTYALYAAYDDTNLYLMWEITNVTDVIDPAQGYPISDNGKPHNGDIPQIIALDLDPNKSGVGTIEDKGIWNIDVNYENGVDTLLYFSSKPTNGTPAIFTLNSSNEFSYEPENCIDFKTAGIKYNFGDGHISNTIMGIKANGYEGYTPADLSSNSANWVDMMKNGHSASQDTMYEMKIPFSALGIDKSHIQNTGIGAMHISTFGASGITSLPLDQSMLDVATLPYSCDASTSAEKEDLDVVTCGLARIGKESGTLPPNPSKTPVPSESPDSSETPDPSETPTSTPEVGNNDDPYTIDLTNASLGNGGSNSGSADKIADGAILHAWCWSFNTIKNNMDKIAEAGYTSVQTSPINNVVVGNGGDLKFTEQWWYHYQPTDYKIGNYQLGSESEFAAMCAEAEKYGVKIIVDVVANHCTSNYNLITPEIKNKANFFHTNKEITNWNDRYQVTQLALLGLWDNNTQNPVVQEYIKNFLIKCVSLGADGFRYDAAKHIELPDDGNFGGNFWPNVLNNGAEFQYGEILQDSISKEAAYANYMSVTASSYGKKIRDNIGRNSLNASTIKNFDISVNSKKIVTWVESHDNYANALHDYGSSQWMTDEQLKLAWAVVCARSGGTPLFFSRPVGGGGSSWDNRFPEKSKIGDLGSALFFDDEVAAVNNFRNAMVGESENLLNPNGDSKVLMIQRGSKGVTIVNMNSGNYSLNSNTQLANGTYTNHTDDNSTFTVSNGKITGTLPGRSVVVLYQASVDGPSVSIDDTNSTFKTDSLELTLRVSGAEKATYSINGNQSYLYTAGHKISIGKNDPANTKYVVKLTAINSKNIYVTKEYTFTKVDPTKGTTVYFQKPANWGNSINAYIYDESGSSVEVLAPWPGSSMTTTNDGIYSFTFTESYTSPLIIFNDGTNQSCGVGASGFAVVNGTTYTVNGPIIVVAPPSAPTAKTINSSSIILNTITGAEYKMNTGSWQSSTTFSGLTPETEYTFYARIASTSTSAASASSEGTKITTSKANIEGSKTTIYYKTSSATNIHYRIASGNWTTAPGVAMSSSTISGYKVAIIDLGNETTLTACFNDGNGNWDNNSKSDYSFGVGTYTVKDGKISKGAPDSNSGKNEITLYYKTTWSAYAHYKVGSNNWTDAPGVKMSASNNTGYQTITIPLGEATTLTACFNNGNGNWDNNSGNNYYFGSPGSYTIKDGKIISGTP